MKINYTLMSIFLAATITTGCSNETEQINLDNNIFPPSTVTAGFAQEDGARPIGSNPGQMVANLLRKTGPDIAKGFGEINIKPEEYEEIKTFTDELVKDCKTETDIYTKIFRWVYSTLEYKHEYEGGDFISNDPYPVFKTHTAICQGFSNIMHVMLESQNIPTLNVNGEYVNVGGHAWNYTYVDKKWVVCDATNNGSFPILSSGAYKHLKPFSIDANLFETDECTFTFQDCALNIDEVKTDKNQFIVPYSVAGYVVTSLSPRKPLPTNIKEIFIGKNIQSLGQYYKGLEKNAPSIEAAYVDPASKRLASYTGVVYKKNGNKLTPYYIPAALKGMELKPMKTVDKNTVFLHNSLEEVIIPTGTEEICDYAFEKCPNLRKAYVPEGVKIAERAFWEVHPDFQVIRGDYTGIPDVTL